MSNGMTSSSWRQEEEVHSDLSGMESNEPPKIEAECELSIREVVDDVEVWKQVDSNNYFYSSISLYEDQEGCRIVGLTSKKEVPFSQHSSVL
jgi:hypothetical protein